MASSWGTSWGTSWGDAWGATGQAAQPAEAAGSVKVRIIRPRMPLYLRARTADEEEAILLHLIN